VPLGNLFAAVGCSTVRRRHGMCRLFPPFFLSFFPFFLLVLEQILMGFVLTIMVVAGEVYFRRVAADHGQKTQHQEHVCDCTR
jgi:hypothetical protein